MMVVADAGGRLSGGRGRIGNGSGRIGNVGRIDNDGDSGGNADLDHLNNLEFLFSNTNLTKIL